MSRSKINVEDQEVNADVNFVSRWSRLKYGSQLKHDARQKSDETVSDKTLSDEAAVKVLTDDDMPDIESMTPDSDYTDFLSPGVSEELRKLALRKLFLSEVFNIRDGLDEYDGDYTQFETLGDIVTSDMKHQLELEAKRKAEQVLQTAPPLDDDRHDDDYGNEQDHDKNNNNDSVDKNKIAACQQEMSQVSQDDAKTSIDADLMSNKTATENLPTDYSLAVGASTDKSTKKLEKNAEYIDLQTNKTDQNKG